MRKSQSGVFRFVFGADREEYAQLFLCLAVLLYLGVCLRFGGFLPDRDALLSVVADDTAPEGVVQVQSQHLFVLAVNGANDSCQAVGKFRNRVQRHGVFVEVPVGIVVPCVQPVACRQIVYIVNVEVVVCGGILPEFPVQFRDEPHHAVAVPPVAVAHEPRCRQFKVVLQNGAVVCCREVFPHLGEVGVLPFSASCTSCSGNGQGQRSFGDVAACGVDKDQIRLKCCQFRSIEHGILPVLCVFRLVEHRLNAAVQQEQFQHGNNVAGGGTAQHGNAFFHAGRAVCQKGFFQFASFLQQKAAVKGIFQFFHL